MDMTGIILSHFNEHKGFVPFLYSSSIKEEGLINDILFRSTLNLVGGTRNLSEERESFIDFPDYQVIDCSYLKGVESSSIKGGIMPIILILFTSNEYKVNIYANLLQIMEDLKILMHKIIPNWKDKKFSNINSLKNLLNSYKSKYEKFFTGNSNDTIEKQSKMFKIACPACSREVSILVPNDIPELLVILITNLPCKHNFEAFFTKGSEFRGTSTIKGSSANDLKDIFDKL